ncbi:hypothetical protein [Streptomyces sp. 11x1]|uniref:hypothetical protein n=1 Tax=Streptomyces sp. 11x1 TaxID=3038642 RepID=UPI00292DD766|nr:hypothetical protein [Streptomyces sp. 11x1]WNZ08989.1 hypothetical protein P8T65_16270 [Streptomyces sp. 11x1]
MAPEVSSPREFLGFELVRRGYDRQQVDLYLAALSEADSSVGPPSFRVVRRGYDCRQVDERIRELLADRGVGGGEGVAPEVSSPREFLGFELVRRGYDRQQVDLYLAALSEADSSVGPPSFRVVRRGYDCRQVDERIRELLADRGVGG